MAKIKEIKLLGDGTPIKCRMIVTQLSNDIEKYQRRFERISCVFPSRHQQFIDKSHERLICIERINGHTRWTKEKSMLVDPLLYRASSRTECKEFYNPTKIK